MIKRVKSINIILLMVILYVTLQFTIFLGPGLSEFVVKEMEVPENFILNDKLREFANRGFCFFDAESSEFVCYPPNHINKITAKILA